MKKFCSILLLSVPFLLCLSCGKKGDLQPPLVRFPQAAMEVQIAQKAEEILLTWLNPIAYEDGSTLSEIDKIEIWVLELKTAEGIPTTEIQAEEFEQKAKLYATIEKDRISEYFVKDRDTEGLMSFSYRLSGEDFLSKKYTFGLRIKDRKRYSPFSALVSLKPEVLPLPPTDVVATVFSDRIEIKWNPPIKNRDQSMPPNLEGFNIYRSEKEGEPRHLNEKLVKGEKYDDKDFSFGQIYKYVVRASATSTSPFLESGDSEEIEILPKDTFAPDPPKGLIFVAGQNVLSITWDANLENDLDGYRVWRREEGTAEFRILTPDLIKENAYNDKAVEKGITYVYFVTALDKSGNESQRSETISDRIRESLL